MSSDRPAIVSRAELEAVGDPRLRASLLRLYDSFHQPGRRRPPGPDAPPDETNDRQVRLPQPRLPYKEEDE